MLIDQMLRRIAHRGPNGQETWSEQGLAIGHQRLFTTPESVYEQFPLAHGSCVITADARIDNRSELIARLGYSEQPRVISDSELILAAYRKWGNACPQQLVGDYAFAIWDNAEGRLFLARDPLGVKPLYYVASGQRFAFASEIAPLLCLPERSVRINPLAVADYLLPSLNVLTDPEATFYESVFSLAAGHSLVVRPGHVEKRQHWMLDPARELRLNSDEAYAEAFLELFTEAVRCRLRSSAPVGVALSGGLDSSSVTCTARELHKSRLHTFYMRSPMQECDERPYVDMVLAGGEIQHHELVMPSPLQGLADGFRVGDTPSTLHNPPLLALQLQAARAIGAGVFLDGVDGDAVIGYGFGYLSELAGARQWSLLAQEIQAMTRHFDATVWASVRHYALPELVHLLRTGQWVRFIRGVHTLSAELDLRQRDLAMRSARLIWPRHVRQRAEQQLAIVNVDFAHSIDLPQLVQSLIDADTRPESERDAHFRALTSGRLQKTLADCDTIAARIGLEIWHPFCDPRVVEFCLALPARQKYRAGWTRYILRQALKHVLPEAICWRSGKTDFGPHVIHSLLTDDKPLLDDLILGDTIDTSTVTAACVNKAAIRDLYQRFRGSPNHGDARTLLRVARLLVWLRDAA